MQLVHAALKVLCSCLMPLSPNAWIISVGSPSIPGALYLGDFLTTSSISISDSSAAVLWSCFASLWNSPKGLSSSKYSHHLSITSNSSISGLPFLSLSLRCYNSSLFSIYFWLLWKTFCRLMSMFFQSPQDFCFAFLIILLVSLKSIIYIIFFS